MGQGQSDADSQLRGIRGLQIVRVLLNSPAHIAGLVPFFDLITAVNGVMLQEGADAIESFKQHVAAQPSQPMHFTVYNLHVRAYRDVVCATSRSWGGGGLLGCSVEWCSAEDFTDRIWHIVEVTPGSPVDRCGDIKEGRDYIIGIQRENGLTAALIKSEEDFYAKVELWRCSQRALVQRLRRRPSVPGALVRVDDRDARAVGKLLLLIYDSDNNEVREVLLDLGGDVSAPLGMNLATGLLHTLPLTHATSEDNEQRLCGGRESDDAVAESVGKLPLVTAFVLPTWTVERVKQPAALDPVDVASSFAAASDKMCQERVSPPPAVAPASAPPSQKVWQEGTAAPATAGPMGPATGDGTNLYNPGAPGGVEMDPMREVVSPQGREMLQLSQQPPTPAPLLCKGSAPEAQTRMLALPSDTLFSKDAPLTSALSAFQQSSPFGGQDVRDTALPHAAAVSEEVQVLPPIEIPSPLQFPVIKPAAPLQ